MIGRVAEKAWDHSIFSKAATAAFWQTLSLPPLLLGLLGSLGYIGGWFGPDTLKIIQSKIITFSRDVFSADVVDQLIAPTVADVLQRGRPGIVSVGFLISLWAGSSAMSTFVDSIVEAHDQHEARHPLWQRIFALILYVAFLITAVFVLPLVALGPTMIAHTLPEPWYDVGSQLLDFFYYPGVALLLIVGLTTLYKLALHTIAAMAPTAGRCAARRRVLHRLRARRCGCICAGWPRPAPATARWPAPSRSCCSRSSSGSPWCSAPSSTPPSRSSGRRAPPGSQQMREWLSAQSHREPDHPTSRPVPSRVATDKMRDLVRGDSREDAHGGRPEPPPPDPAPRRDPTQVSGRLTESRSSLRGDRTGSAR